MRNDIDEMKIHISEILKKLDALGRKEPEGTPQRPVYDPSYQFGFNPVQMGPIPLTMQVPQQNQVESFEVQWPPYGLPPGYTPPTAQDPQIAQPS
jgi:hypothetical protein